MSRATLDIEGFISEPRSRVSRNGGSLCDVSVAHTPRRFNKKSQQWEDFLDQNGQKQTLWVRATFFDDVADLLASTLHKGDIVRLTGEPVVSVWTDQQGVSKASVEVRNPSLSVVPLPQRSPQGGGFAEPAQDGWGQSAGQHGWAQPAQPQPAQQAFGAFDSEQPF